MIKRFDEKATPLLSSVIDSIGSSLQCTKYIQVANRIEISLLENVSFIEQENLALAKKGFGTCLTRFYEYGSWDVSIIINMEKCLQANLTEREISAIILHELGHILNEPELQDEPTFEFCFMNGIEFSEVVLENVKKLNSMNMEIFADSYANKHGYGKELISTFKKQNECFEQKIRYNSIRIKKILNREILEGRFISLNKKDGT